MKSGFQYTTEFIFRYRSWLVISVVIILHVQVFVHFSERIKIQSHDFIPKKIISAAVILKPGTNSLASVLLKSEDVLTEHSPASKDMQTDVTNQINHSGIKETASASNFVKNKNISNNADQRKRSDSSKSVNSANHSDSSKSADSSKGIVPVDRMQEKPKEFADYRSDLNSVRDMPIQLASPRFRHRRPIPVYPQQALRMGEAGLVVIRVLISENGQVTQAVVHQSSGSAWLDSAAEQAALKAQFYPHIVDGVAFQTQADLPFRFVMK